MKKSKLPGVPSLTAAAIAVVLAGCSVNPVQVTPEEVAQRVANDQAQMYKDQVPLAAPISYSDALARALKYNLDYRLKLMESALARGLLDVSAADMLPKLVADAGYNDRSNDSGGTSIGIEDRIVSLRPSTSEERTHYYGRATLSWNALDFGLAYFRAKQAADEVNIAEERRRKILQNIVQDVRNAYWRALGAQRLLADADQLATRIEDALAKSREAERAGVLPPTQGLAYQRALLDAMTLVNLKRQEMQFAKRELAALMSLPPGTEFTLVRQPGGQVRTRHARHRQARTRRRSRTGPSCARRTTRHASASTRPRSRSPRCSRASTCTPARATTRTSCSTTAAGATSA